MSSPCVLWQEEDEGIYDSIQMLRDQNKELQDKISDMSLDPMERMKYHQQLCDTQKALFMRKEQRKERYCVYVTDQRAASLRQRELSAGFGETIHLSWWVCEAQWFLGLNSDIFA